jgi:hypothetical protein
MRQITQKITHAFEGRYALRIDNSRTDGDSLWLFGNRIAEWRRDGLWISNAGWNSKTTKERLNGLTGVSISQRAGTWYLNDREWDGSWVNVYNWSRGEVAQVEAEQVASEPEFDTTSEWVEEGYSRPVYSVCHTLVESLLEQVEQKLSEAGIPTKRMESDTTGVYKPNYFVIVHPENFETAVNILTQ